MRFLDRFRSARHSQMQVITDALNNVTSNVMIADNDRRITYMNKSVIEMMTTAEADIRRDLPNFDVKKLMGGSIDSFHKNPLHQMAMLSALKKTHRTEIKVGGRTFGLIASPITSSTGKRLGTVVEWKDRSAEVRLETELASHQQKLQTIAIENLRIRNALDVGNTSTMIADNDLRIVYINEAVQKLLTEAESDIRKDLPGFSVANLLGSSIDQFHVNPQHQREMLARLTQTHRAKIKVGGRDFILTLTPIVDHAGVRAGTVVEWIDRTAEFKSEQEISDVVERAGTGDFTPRIETTGKTGFFKVMADGINLLMETLVTIVDQVKDSSLRINGAAGDIAAGNIDLASRTEQQAASLEETASSMEQLTSAVRNNSESARQASQLARGAAEVASKGGAAVGEVVTVMGAINASSKKIVDIISVIDGIAFQTNILALNAAVEAARAGEQGRGFAVVAAEVRSLAQRSASAAKEIKTLIGDSVEKVSTGSQLVALAGETMGEIVGSVKRVTDIINEISAASDEQSRGIEQVNSAITQLDEVTQKNSSLVEAGTTSARALESQSSEMMQAVARFRTGTLAAAASVVVPIKPSERPGERPSEKAARTTTPSAPMKRKASATKMASAAPSRSGENWSEF